MSWEDETCETIHAHPQWPHLQSAILQQDAWTRDNAEVEDVCVRRGIDPSVMMHMAEFRAKSMMQDKFGIPAFLITEGPALDILSTFMALWIDGFITGMSVQKTLEHGL